MKKLNQKGFTLLELLAVLVIMAALAVIAIPIFLNKGDEARVQSHKANIREITNAIQRYEWENGQPAVTAATANFYTASGHYYGLLDANNALVTGKFLSAAVVSPITSKKIYTTTTPFTVTTTTTTSAALSPSYVIGKDSTGNTTVKLICAGDGTAPILPTSTGTAVPNQFVVDTDAKFITTHGATATTMTEVLGIVNSSNVPMLGARQSD